MNSSHRHKNRRTTSKVMPRVFLLLQLLIMMLLSYITYKILTAVGMTENFVYTALFIANLYYLSKLFLKCKNVLRRNDFGRGFQT